MIRRGGAPDDRAGRHEVNGELTSDRRVLEVGDALRREQKREDVAILAGLARCERGNRPDRQAEIEANAVDVAGADACAGQNEQTVLRQEIAELVHEREDRVRAAIHDGAASDLHDLQVRSWIGRLSATGRVSSLSRRVWRASGEATCLILLVVWPWRLISQRAVMM